LRAFSLANLPVDTGGNLSRFVEKAENVLLVLVVLKGVNAVEKLFEDERSGKFLHLEEEGAFEGLVISSRLNRNNHTSISSAEDPLWLSYTSYSHSIGDSSKSRLSIINSKLLKYTTISYLNTQIIPVIKI
jgi:hypothetical protein